ncbi:MAG: acetate--CoA ligase family protein [Alphaproteobacteria bacterium]|nr:acetate--CoA ligase family protein [Alphaproteobacteria bacterium]
MDTETSLLEHRITPLLAPKSIALVGASEREGSVGRMMVEVLQAGGFGGAVHAINPKYETVLGLPCVAGLGDLSQAPDLAVLSVAAHRMEQTMADAIASGARSAVVFDPCFYQGDEAPLLLDRLKGLAREAAFPVCGGNGMGFINHDSSTWVSFQEPLFTKPGGIAMFCHSGSIFGLMLNGARRYRFSMLVSQGQEIGATAADYIDYALERPTTRVIGLFLEAVRDPQAFVAALEKAHARGVPVVINKIARTEQSAALAMTHSGAIAGSDSAFRALCDRHGVLLCDEIETMMSTLQIMAQDRRPGPGELGAATDSGGLREHLIDVADDMGVDFAPLTQETTKALRETLAFGLEPVNPMDAAGPLTADFVERLNEAAKILAIDPNVAVMAHELFIDDHFCFCPEAIDYVCKLPEVTGKPHLFVSSLGSADTGATAERLEDAGIPMISGTRPMLAAVKNALAWRDDQERNRDSPGEADAVVVARWRERLAAGAMDETEALAMLGAFGVPVVRSDVCETGEAAVEAACEIGFPVVLKTAMPGIAHKSDVGGVMVRLADETALDEAYAVMSAALGPRVAVAAMVPKGVEIALGMVRDPQYGPMVMVGAGGVLVEQLDDRAFALAPFGIDDAYRLLDRLKIKRLLEGMRGAPPADLESLALAISRFSVMAAALADGIAEMDINPMIAGPDGAIAVDALVVAQDN